MNGEHQATREGTEYSDWMQLRENVFTPVPISSFLCEREPKNELTGTLKHRQRDQEAPSQKNISFLSLNQRHAVTVATLRWEFQMYPQILPGQMR